MDAALRREVVERAGSRCEYCRLKQDHQPAVSLQIEHVIARQHGGDDSFGNLALACLRCNLHKGTNLSGIDPQSGAVTRLFNPRLDSWTEHFKFAYGRVIGLTPSGRTTVNLFHMNSPERVDLRLELQNAGLWD
jgi:hypothetical protein